MVKFIGSDLIANGPDPLAGRTPSETERFREVVANAVLYKQLGFDKVHRYYDALGQTVLTVGGHQRGLTRTQFVDSLELFKSDVAPQLRRSIAEPPWPSSAAA